MGEKYQYIYPDTLAQPFRYYNDKLSVARKHGFNSWIEFLYEAYAQYESCAKLSKICGMSKDGVRDSLLKIGVKIKGKGRHKNG